MVSLGYFLKWTIPFKWTVLGENDINIICNSCKLSMLGVCGDFVADHHARILWGETLCAESWDSATSSVLVMQESPRVGVSWSVISLNGLSYKDAGEYRCQARNMAGISEAPIKLKVVGVTRLSRLPKKKSQKTPPKSSSKYRKPNQTLAANPTPSMKENQILQNITPPTPINNPQKAPDLVSKVFPIGKYIKRRKINQTDTKKNVQTSINTSPEWSDRSTTLMSETLEWDPVKLVSVSVSAFVRFILHFKITHCMLMTNPTWL